jgi:hypothetical protein
MNDKPYHFDSSDKGDPINPGEGSWTTMISIHAIQLLQESYGVAEGRYFTRGDVILTLIQDTPGWTNDLNEKELYDFWLRLGRRLGLSPDSVDHPVD